MSLFRNLKDGKFGRLHHGFLNHRQHLYHLLSHVDQYPGFVEFAEGDICWLAENGEDPILFMHHPALGNRLPDRETILQNLEKGEYMCLEEILTDQFAPLGMVIELKDGRGDRTRAFEKMLELLETKRHGRYWIDTFSSKDLQQVKAISPETVTSLHSRFGVVGRQVIRTAFQAPYLGLSNLYRLPHIDIVTVTYKYSLANVLKNASIESIHEHVFKAGKQLVFGGIQSVETFDLVQQSTAIAAYQKYDKKTFSRSFMPS